MSSFRFEKWYMDAVAPDGRAFIGYAATLGWRGAQLRYHGELHLDGGDPPQTRSSFRHTSLPRLDTDSLLWNAHGTAGEWRSLALPIEETLLDTGAGSIHWHCTQPKAEAAVHSASRAPLIGHGYTERMVMTLPPWELPIDELRWGRFISPRHAVVWIEWRGALPKLLIVHNGTRYCDGAIDQHSVRFGNVQLRLLEGRTLRSGSLGSTLFSGALRVARRLPVAALRIEELKWCSAGALRVDDGGEEVGWAIHETVRWQR